MNLLEVLLDDTSSLMAASTFLLASFAIHHVPAARVHLAPEIY